MVKYQQKCKSSHYSKIKHPWFQLEQEIELTLNALDMILMRKDPPVDMDYIYATQLLDIAEKQGAIIFNKPCALRDANEKIFANWFPDCCPPTLIGSDSLAIKEFLKEQKEIILKPVNGMGGQGIFRIKQNELNLNVILETLTQYEESPYYRATLFARNSSR